MSIKPTQQSVSSVKQPPLVETHVLEKKNRIGKTIQWVRKCEVGSPVERISICVLKFLATFVLLVSLIGIPFFFDLYDEYLSQSFEEKHASLVDRLKTANIQIQTNSEKVIGKMGAQVNGLKEELAIEKDAAKVSKSEFATLQDYLKDLRKQLREFEALNKDLDLEKTTLKGKVGIQQKQLQDASTHILELRALLDVYQKQKASLQERISSAQEAVRQFETLLNTTQRQKNELTDKLKAAQAEASREQEGLRQLLEVPNQMINELQATIKQLQDRIEADKEASTDLQARLQDVTSRLTTRENELRGAAELIRTRAVELEQVQNELAQLKKVHSLATELEQHSSLIQQQGYADLFRVIGEKQATVTALEQELSLLKKEFQQTVKDIIQKETEGLTEQVRTLEAQLQNKTQSNETAKRESEYLAELETVTKALLERNQHVYAQNELLTKENQQLRAQFRSRGAVGDKMGLHAASSNKELGHRLESTRRKLQRAETRILELEGENRILTTSADDNTGFADTSIERLRQLQKHHSLTRERYDLQLSETNENNIRLIAENSRFESALRFASNAPRAYRSLFKEHGLEASLKHIDSDDFKYELEEETPRARDLAGSFTLGSPREAFSPRSTLARTETHLEVAQSNALTLPDLESAETSLDQRFDAGSHKQHSQLEKEDSKRSDGKTKRVREEQKRPTTTLKAQDQTNASNAEEAPLSSG